MDNLTHSLVGALIGQAGLKRKTGLAMPALVIGANIPDIDAACLFWLDGVEHLGFRRGITHGPVAWVLLPLLLASLLYAYDRWQAKRGKRPEKRLPVHFGWLWALALIGCLTHPAMDWMNVYGIRLLEPFSSRWFYGDVLFIIDIWLWLGLGFASWFSLRREKRGGEWRRPARIALAALLAYIGVNGVVSGQTKAAPGATTTISNPLPVISFAREEISGNRNDWYYWHDSAQSWVPLVEAEKRCSWPHVAALLESRPDLEAFLFCSRAPFVELHPNGTGMVLRDARFYNRQVIGGFAVELPHLPCEPHGQVHH